MHLEEKKRMRCLKIVLSSVLAVKINKRKQDSKWEYLYIYILSIHAFCKFNNKIISKIQNSLKKQ